ncbi:MAG: hypothetical protein M3162_05740 [Thermoproteota archaeon]|nr:hypothetical protein [Thermoproteota archaeon]
MYANSRIPIVVSLILPCFLVPDLNLDDFVDTVKDNNDNEVDLDKTIEKEAKVVDDDTDFDDYKTSLLKKRKSLKHTHR